MLITDIHAHILPGLDDGPKNMASTIALLEGMQQTHTDRVFCTSHFRSPHFSSVETDQIDTAFQNVTTYRALYPTESHTRVTIRCGAEIRLASALAEDIFNENIPTLGNTKYVLVEFATTEISELALSLLYELSIRHFTPIVAHPERNLAVQHNPGLVEAMRASGALMQGTAQCFLSEDGVSNHRAFKLAWSLLEQGKLDVIASDAHNTTTRPPGLLEAYERIAGKYGDEVSEALMANANAIWDDRACTPIEIRAKMSSRLSVQGSLQRS